MCERTPVHQDREIIERRLARVRHEYITPAIWGPRRQLDAVMWSVPDSADGTVGEPVPVEECLAATDWVTARPGTAWGRPWGTVWFRSPARSRPTGPGRPVEAILNLGFNDLAPGFMGEGLVWRWRRVGGVGARAGLHPANHIVRITDAADGGEQVSYLVEASANPLMWGLGSTPQSDRDTAGSHPIYVVSAIDLAVVNTDVWDLHHDLARPDRADEGAPARRAAPVGDPALASIAASTRSSSRTWSAPRSRRGPSWPTCCRVRRSRPRTAVRGRPRPHRHRLAVAPPGDRAEVTRSFSNALRLAEDDPEFRFALLPGRPVRLDAPGPPERVRRHRRRRRPGPVDPGRRHAGSRPTATSPAASRWPASSSTVSGSSASTSA